MYSCNYFDNDGHRSRRSFSTDLIFVDEVSTAS